MTIQLSESKARNIVAQIVASNLAVAYASLMAVGKSEEWAREEVDRYYERKKEEIKGEPI